LGIGNHISQDLDKTSNARSDGTVDRWHIKFDQVRADGFSRLHGLWVLQEIVTPILTKLLTALCVPYVFSRGLFPLFGYSLIINSAVYRFAWLGCLTLGLLWYCIKIFHQRFMKEAYFLIVLASGSFTMGDALLSELLSQILIPIAVVIGIGFALLQWLLMSRVKVDTEKASSLTYGV